MSEKTHEEIALGLWRAWFKWSGEPYEISDHGMYEFCFFCGEQKGQAHLLECPYVGAAKLLGVECK